MLGERIKALREKRGMTQTDLATRAGLSQAYVAMLEAGVKQNPSLDILNRLAKALGVKVGRLIG